MNPATKRRISLSLLISVALVVSSALSVGIATTATAVELPPPATSAVRTCTQGEYISEVIPGDLVVPFGVHCDLSYAAVRGRTTVNGSLRAAHVTFKKTITVNTRAAFEARATTMWAWIVSHKALTINLVDVTLVGSLVGSIAPHPNGTPARVSLYLAKIRGSVGIIGSGFDRHSLYMNHSEINGTVSFQGAEYFSTYGRVGQAANIQANKSATICGTRMDGSVTVQGTRGWGGRSSSVEIGGSQCENTTVIRYLLLWSNFTDSNTISRVRILEDLDCENNRPVPVLTDVVVLGNRLGQCA